MFGQRLTFSGAAIPVFNQACELIGFVPPQHLGLLQSNLQAADLILQPGQARIALLPHSDQGLAQLSFKRRLLARMHGASAFPDLIPFSKEIRICLLQPVVLTTSIG